MKITQKIIPVCVLGLMVFVLNGCVKLQNPTINFVGQSIQSIDMQRIKLNLNFAVYNPNDLGADKANCSYIVYVKNIECFRGDNVPFSLPGKVTTNLILPVEVEYIKVFNSAFAVLQAVMAGEKDLPYKVEGSIGTSIMGIPVSMPIATQGLIPIPK